MPIQVPSIDDRTYEQLRADALARIPVHNPEWTNFTEADPGVTLLELFAFLTESLLYRANQIPERNRRAFLSLLGIPLQPATAAAGLAVVENRSGPARTTTLPVGVALRAGKVPFRTDQALDVLPIEARIFRKRRYTAAGEELRAEYDALYAAQRLGTEATDLDLYVPTRFPEPDARPVDLGDPDEAVDGSLWIALLVRAADAADDDARARMRAELAGKTVNLGLAVAPALQQGRQLRPGGPSSDADAAQLLVQVPDVRPLPDDDARRDASYSTLASFPLPEDPTAVAVTLPGRPEQLATWEGLKPLEEGTRDFPPALESPDLAARVITWLRVRSTAAPARITWLGVNAVGITQRERVVAERLTDGTGEPDQARTLAHRPMLSETLRLTVSTSAGTREWRQVADLLAAPAETAAGSSSSAAQPASEVYALDPEAGRVRFGDGLHGARPPPGATLLATYDFAAGSAGNVGAGAVRSGPDLPAGFVVDNPLPTRGGADAETVARGEKQVARWLQHRDRLVSAADFEALTLRTPGGDVGRVEVLAAWHPDTSREPGDAPGCVTLLVVPRSDPYPPAIDGPDTFLESIARWLEPRRLVTTELHLRRPTYVPVWVSVGVDVIAGIAPAALRVAIEDAVAAFLSPLPEEGVDPLEDQLALFDRPQRAAERRGWPLRAPVSASELLTWVARVPGVQRVRGVRIAGTSGELPDAIPMEKLQLPRLAGIAVAVGSAPPDVASLIGGAPPPAASKPMVPVPVVPEECR